MEQGWIRFGCFLTGYKYAWVKNSSEACVNTVKRYTSALLILMVLWAFTGYVFTQRYLLGNTACCLVGSAVMVLLIIQIERQILLSLSPNRWLYFARSLLAILMALLGSLLMDQIVFRQDIDLEKMAYVQEKVHALFPGATEELRSQLEEENQEIKNLETQRLEDVNEVSEKPFFKEVSTQSLPQKVMESHTDKSGKAFRMERLVYSHSISTVSIPNPKQTQILEINKNLEGLQKDKKEKENKLLKIREDMENRFQSRSGFLDELTILFRILSRSVPALVVWGIWFLFLLGLELLVLISKSGDLKTDYEEAIFNQMEIKNVRLSTLRVKGI